MKKIIVLLSMLYLVHAEAQILGGDPKLKVDFGGDAQVRGFTKKTNNNTKEQGYAQLLRMKVDFQASDKVKVSTRTILSGSGWNGDQPNNRIGGNNDLGNASNLNGGEGVRLDYGYLEVPITDGWVARAGRQEANFSDCFNTCDERRDRLMVYKFYGNLLPALLMDKRAENQTNNEKDDADMYAAALFHIHRVHEWALLYAYFQNDDGSYVLDGVHNFSPYYKYKGEKFTGFVVYNWLGGGKDDAWFDDNHHSYALKGEYRLTNRWEVGAQYIASIDGGLIATGYDTYSIAVNNSPEYNASNSLLVSLGGLGTASGGDKDDEHMFIGRVKGYFGDITATAAVGKARETRTAGTIEEDLMIYDFQAHYQYSARTKFIAGLALVRDDRTEETSVLQVNTSF